VPIYEYECPKCGVIEEFQGINDKPLTKCPVCKRCKVKKLVSESSFHLKGTGWYVTDYAKGNGKANGNGDGSTKQETETKPETPKPKTETKTETKKESSGSKKKESGASASASH
jgi:putative FmdB family regulatory protein